MDTAQIEQAVASGNKHVAVQLLEQLGNDSPHDAVMACYRARMYIELGRFERAAAAARQAIDLDGHNVEGWLWLARAHWSGRRIAQAQQTFERARQLSDDAPEVFAEYAMFMGDERGPNISEPVIAKALEIAGERADTWAAVACLHKRQGRLIEAEQAAKHALEIDPDHTVALAVMSGMLTAQSRDASAYAPRVEKREVVKHYMKDVVDGQTKQRVARHMLDREDGVNMLLNQRELPRFAVWQKWAISVGPAVLLCGFGLALAVWQSQPFYFVPTLAVLGWSIFRQMYDDGE